MLEKLKEQAIKLSARPYREEILLDKTTDGELIFLAVNTELSGCMAQGTTIEEASANLEDARIEYISSLLEDDVPIPAPITGSTVTTASKPTEWTYTVTVDDDTLPDDLLQVESAESERLYAVSSET